VPEHWEKRKADEDVARTKREVLPGIALGEKHELIERRHFSLSCVNETDTQDRKLKFMVAHAQVKVW
jgi:hypothetical protein